ncbi:MAG: polynucleotide adenylyltransferase PcnB [Gammaproteobacteria bacterium]
MTSRQTDNVTYLHQEPVIYPREAHCISRKNISEAALNILYRLNKAGFDAYLVGGSVRDLLLGREPKDFDVATDATPEQINELFRSSRLIGKRFRLAHVRYGGEIIEVSTFRAPHRMSDDGHSVDGRIIRDNVYGSIDEDVWRRDFTVNALFYSIRDYSVVDYVNGMGDIKSGHIRLIGDPEQRFTEDPVRLLRAIRFATKLGFVMDDDVKQHIHRLAPLLTEMPAARLFEECLKMFTGGCALQTFEQLRHYNLFASLFPQTEEALAEEEGGFPHTLVYHALDNTDKRLAEDKSVTPGFLLAALLWLPVERLCREYMEQGQSQHDALTLAGDVVISKQTRSTAMPRRFTHIARDIWQLQPRLLRKTNRRPMRLLEHPRFRAAYDFLLLRAQSGDDVQEMADWWTRFQEQNPVPENRRPRTSRPRRGRSRSRNRKQG